jgi:hypothetical protein
MTSGGVVLDVATLDRLATEAEAGYPLSALRRRLSHD